MGGSGRQFAAALAASRGDDGAPRPGAHAQPEPVSPRTATVVRLERALALGHGCRSPGARFAVQGRGRRGCGRSGHPRPAPATLLRAGPSVRPEQAMDESTQEYPPVGGRLLERRRPVPAPSKRASGVTARATRRYIHDACTRGVLVAAPDACSRACSCGAGRRVATDPLADTSGIRPWGIQRVRRSLQLTVMHSCGQPCGRPRGS